MTIDSNDGFSFVSSVRPHTTDERFRGDLAHFSFQCFRLVMAAANSKTNLNSEWTALVTLGNCVYFRGNPEGDRSMNPIKRGTEEGEQSEGNPKRGI